MAVPHTERTAVLVNSSLAFTSIAHCANSVHQAIGPESCSETRSIKSVCRRATPAPIIRLSTSNFFLQRSLKNSTHLALSFPAAISLATILSQPKVNIFWLRFVLRCSKLHVARKECESKAVTIFHHLKPK